MGVKSKNSLNNHMTIASNVDTNTLQFNVEPNDHQRYVLSADKNNKFICLSIII